MKTAFDHGIVAAVAIGKLSTDVPHGNKLLVTNMKVVEYWLYGLGRGIIVKQQKDAYARISQVS